MCWVVGGMWRGVEYLEELGNAQLWQISVSGSWRDNASLLRRSSICSALHAAVGWDMSHASPTRELQKAQARAAGCRSRRLGRCTFPYVCHLPSVDDFLLPLPLLYLGYREPFKVDDFKRSERLHAHTVAAELGEGVCTASVSPVTQHTMWRFQWIPKEWIQMDFMVIKSIIY